MPVYMIRAGEDGPVGFIVHKGETFIRNDIQCAHIEPLIVVRKIAGGRREMEWLRSHYKHLHIKNHWHHYCGSVLSVAVPDNLSARQQEHPAGSVCIPLSDGWSTFIDPSDVPLVSGDNWFVKRGSASGQKLYAMAWRKVAGNPRMLLMHRLISGAKRGLDVDHINGDGLDNRRCNLRIATRSQNIANSKRLVGRSGFRGVHAHKNGRFYVSAEIHNKRISGGGFSTPEDAARAYDDLATKHWGEFAILNFPRSAKSKTEAAACSSSP